MTEQEAIDLIKFVPLYRYECELEKGRQSELFEALNLAIKALEKQIAKKPKDDDGYYCPFCDYRVDDDGRGYKQPYCMECGQKLDWSEAE